MKINQGLIGVRVLVAIAAILLLPVMLAAQTPLLPDLEPFPASDIQLVSGVDGLELRFSATSWNRGAGPFEIHGGEITGPDKQNVYQWVYNTDGGHSTYLIGEFQYHGGTHNHVHLENYTLYTLQPVNAPGGSAREGAKISFCLLDNTKVNTRLPNAPKKAVYVTCNPDIQGISVGWGDRYGSHLDGQSLPFGNNPSGDYLLKIKVDPNGKFQEANASNNESCALLRINAAALSVQVIGTSCNQTPSVIVSSISPNSLAAGTSTTVTISGSGFAAGMGVSFENGSGKTPTASNVIVVDGSTITATVSVQSGGSPSDPVWDVRVGPALLLNGFTVTR